MLTNKLLVFLEANLSRKLMSIAANPKDYLTIISFVAIGIAFFTSMKELENKKGAPYASMALGVWGDILLVLFPFLIYFCIGWWRDTIDVVLLSPELAMASTIITGQGMLKFFRGLILSRVLVEHIERALFIVMLTLFLFAISLVVVVLIVISTPPPDFVAYVQPPLLFVAVVAYFATAGSGDWVVKQKAMAEASAKNQN